MRAAQVRVLTIAVLFAIVGSAAGCSNDAGGLPTAQPPTARAQSVAAESSPDASNEGAVNHHNFAAEGVTRIAVVDARYAFDAGVATFLDVRNGRSYEAAHVPGAVWIPLEDLAARASELDPAGIIITYCT